jgi:hypothetical protein
MKLFGTRKDGKVYPKGDCSEKRCVACGEPTDDTVKGVPVCLKCIGKTSRPVRSLPANGDD